MRHVAVNPVAAALFLTADCVVMCVVFNFEVDTAVVAHAELPGSASQSAELVLESLRAAAAAAAAAAPPPPPPPQAAPAPATATATAPAPQLGFDYTDSGPYVAMNRSSAIAAIIQYLRQYTSIDALK